MRDTFHLSVKSEIVPILLKLEGLASQNLKLDSLKVNTKICLEYINYHFVERFFLSKNYKKKSGNYDLIKDSTFQKFFLYFCNNTSKLEILIKILAFGKKIF